MKPKEMCKQYQLLIPQPNIVQAQKHIIIRRLLSAQQPLQHIHQRSTVQAPRPTIIHIHSTALHPLHQQSILSLMLFQHPQLTPLPSIAVTRKLTTIQRLTSALLRLEVL